MGTLLSKHPCGTAQGPGELTMSHALCMPVLQTTSAFDAQAFEHCVPVATAQHRFLPGSVQSLGPRHSTV
jgi:hypothetical protein